MDHLPIDIVVDVIAPFLDNAARACANGVCKYWNETIPTPVWEPFYELAIYYDVFGNHRVYSFNTNGRQKQFSFRHFPKSLGVQSKVVIQIVYPYDPLKIDITSAIQLYESVVETFKRMYNFTLFNPPVSPLWQGVDILTNDITLFRITHDHNWDVEKFLSRTVMAMTDGTWNIQDMHFRGSSTYPVQKEDAERHLRSMLCERQANRAFSLLFSFLSPPSQ